MQALRVPPSLQHAPGELVDDLDLTVLHEIVDIALEECRRPQSLHEMVDELTREVLVDVVDAEFSLHPSQTLLGDGHGALLLVDLVVLILAGFQPPSDTREVVVGLGGPFARSGDYERGTRLVDEDGVDLVDYAVEVAALDLLIQMQHHVVAQIVKAELGVGPVDDIGQVGLPPCRGIHVVLE